MMKLYPEIGKIALAVCCMGMLFQNNLLNAQANAAGPICGKSFELAVVGVNLFDPLHQEYAPDFVPSQPAYQPRQGFVQGMWRF